MKVLVPVDTDIEGSAAVVDAILERAWPGDTTFYLLDVIRGDHGVPLEVRVRALSEMMRILEIKLPQSAVFMEVMKEGPFDCVTARADELQADIVLDGRDVSSCLS